MEDKEIKKNSVPSPFTEDSDFQKAIERVQKAKAEKKYIAFHESFVERYPEIRAFVRVENVTFLEFTGTHYSPISEFGMMTKIFALMKETDMDVDATSARKKKDALGRLKEHYYNTPGLYFTEKNISPLLTLRNCNINPLTKETTDHTPDILTLAEAPVDYDKDATIDRFQRYLDTITMGNKETQQALAEVFGYLLLKDNPHHKMFFLHGATARNGKSTFTKIVANLLGDANVSALSLEEITKGGHILALLENKRVNITDEVSTRYFEASQITSLTAEPVITINPKFQQAYSTRLTAKFIASCNNLPQFQEIQGMRKRMVIVPFHYQIAEAERVANLDRVLTEEEGAGILNWALDGLERLKKNSWVFTKSEEMQDEDDQYARENDRVRAFLEENFYYEEGYQHIITITEMFGQPRMKDTDPTGFILWCEKQKIKSVSKQKFTKDLKRWAEETGKITPKRNAVERGYIRLAKITDSDESVFYQNPGGGKIDDF
jgi:putative DNA primase/helicase